MRHLIAGGVGGPSRHVQRFYIRDGLAPALDTSVIESIDPNISPSTSRQFKFAVTPDKTKAVLANGTGTPNIWWLWEDIEDPSIRHVPPIAFPIAVNEVAASNDFYALCGNSGNLYVISWVGHQLQTVTQTGLGNCHSMDFSPDGAKLAVVHSTSPYLRVYNTGDWSYVDAPANAGAGRAGVRFTESGGYLITTGSSSPQITVFDGSLADVALVINNTAYSSDTSRSVNPLIRDPSNPDSVIACRTSSSASVPAIYRINMSTREVSGPNQPFGCYSICHIGGGRLIATHQELNGRNCSLFDLESMLILPEESQPTDLTYLPIYDYSTFFSVVRDEFRISGTVRDIENNPAAREVLAYKRSNGLLMGRVMSEPDTGNYSMTLPDEGPYDVQFRTAEGELLNDLFFARAVPEPV